MTTSLNPKLLDVVRFKSTKTGPPSVPRTGTIVELFGSEVALVEVSDGSGIPEDFVSVPICDLEIVWDSSKAMAKEELVDAAQQAFEEGLLLLQNARPGAAMEKFRKAFERQPNLARVLLTMTNELANKGNFDAALLLYGLITQLQPGYFIARENLAITRLNRGVQYARVGALDKAVEDFTGALSLGSDDIAPLCCNNLAAMHTQNGLHHIQIKRVSEAFQFFLAALHLAPSNTTRRNFALALVSLLAWGQEGVMGIPPTISFTEAMLIGLTYSECLNAYGATIASIGKSTEARAIIERALEVDSSNELARKNLEILSKEEHRDIVPPEMWGLLSAEPKSADLSIQ